MYYWIWKKLPGGFALKVIQIAILTAGATVLLYFQVFPWLDTVVFPETESGL